MGGWVVLVRSVSISLRSPNRSTEGGVFFFLTPELRSGSSGCSLSLGVLVLEVDSPGLSPGCPLFILPDVLLLHLVVFSLFWWCNREQQLLGLVLLLLGPAWFPVHSTF